MQYSYVRCILFVRSFYCLPRIMHLASRFCTRSRRVHAVDPSGWIGVRQLAVQCVGV